MRTTTVKTPIKSTLKFFAPLLAGGLLAIGTSSTALADGGRGYSHGNEQYCNHEVGYERDRPGYAYGHRKHHKRHKRHKRHKTVHVYHHYEPQAVPDPRPIYVEPRYNEPRRPVYSDDGYRGPTAGSLIGAAVGGFLGAQVGKGNGKLAATAAGTLTGYWIGDRYVRSH
jgi:hypothetical protein